LEPTLSPTTLTAITFDFWDTLVHAPREVANREVRTRHLADALAEAGLYATTPMIEAAIDEVRRAFDRSWSGNRQFHAEDAVDVLLKCLADDSADVGPAHRATLVQIVRGDDRLVPSLTPNIADTLRRLKERDVRLGIICDVGFAPSPVLRGHLRHHGVLDLFDHWSFSDEVGVYKPDPVIFRHALDGLGVSDPGTAVHVGDLRRTDVAGARGFGMVSVRYTGSNNDVPVPAEGDRARLGSSGIEPADRIEADHVIADHAELPALLGIT
jgi:FMN phosphatase YigB (HAD superfamily)